MGFRYSASFPESASDTERSDSSGTGSSSSELRSYNMIISYYDTSPGAGFESADFGSPIEPMAGYFGNPEEKAAFENVLEGLNIGLIDNSRLGPGTITTTTIPENTLFSSNGQ